MNASSVTQWLHSPDELPEAYEVAAAIANWPWFVPARLMSIAHERARDGVISVKILDQMQLYGALWSPAYAHVAGLKTRRYEPLDTKGLEAIVTRITPPPAIDAIVEIKKTSAATEVDKEEAVELNQAEEAIVFQSEEVLKSANEHQDEGPVIPIQPLYTEDYFRHEGIAVKPEEAAHPHQATPQTLMVMMSFSDWLNHFKVKTEQEESEAREKRALRSMWQQEKLAAALQDEPDEIPEDVFEMAVSSITREESLVSESLATVLEQQEKWSAAADMYRKLALRNPAKSSYFAARAEAAKKRLL